MGAAPGTGWRFPGTFMAYTMTKNETVEQAAKAIMAEIERMLAEPVTADELQFAKDLILNSEVFNYDTKREVLDRLVTLRDVRLPARLPAAVPGRRAGADARGHPGRRARPPGSPRT